MGGSRTLVPRWRAAMSASPQEDAHLRVLRVLQNQPDISQRELAEQLGVSLGKVNYLLKGLAGKGWVKARNFKNSRNKWGYLYQLTPAGVEQKTRITLRYLARRMEEYAHLKSELELLKRELRAHSPLDASQNDRD